MFTYDEVELALDERWAFVFDFQRRKPSGGSLSSATGKIKLPSGTQNTLNTAVAISGDTVTATVIGGTDATAAGDHQLDVLVTMSNSEKVHLRIPLSIVAAA